MTKNFIAPIIRNEFDISPASKVIRHAYHSLKHRARELKNGATPESLRSAAEGWWYYSAELAPGVTARGVVPSHFPCGPRILMRKCGLAGMDCIDLGTMEGVIPVLMRRGNARRVVAADASYHCYEKLRLLQRQYDVAFEFDQIGLMYDLSQKLRRYAPFDLVVLGGVLYHVFSPLHVLAGVRPLLKKNGILIVSTNVVKNAPCSALFNEAGKLQAEANTFWYLSVAMFEYALRYFRLLPIDYVYMPHTETKLRVHGLDSGLLTAACRASEDLALEPTDSWARNSADTSWEYRQLCDVEMLKGQPYSSIVYGAIDERFARPDGLSIDLARAVETGPSLDRAERLEDAAFLRLEDRS